VGALIGEALPTTHAMRIVRGMLLRDNGLAEIFPDVWPIALFMLITVSVVVWFAAKPWSDRECITDPIVPTPTIAIRMAATAGISEPLLRRMPESRLPQ
jgi:hypothetical protein